MRVGRDFDLLSDRESPPLVAWLLLLAGVAVLVTVADGYQQASEENEQLTHQNERLERKVKRASPPAAVRRGDERLVVAERRPTAAFPWDVVLREVELAADARVAVLSLETDAVSRQTRIAAEARDIDDAIGFAARLRESPKAREAFLLSHEVKKGTPVPVIGVTVQVEWRND